MQGWGERKDKMITHNSIMLHNIKYLAVGPIKKQKHPTDQSVYYTRDIIIQQGDVDNGFTLFSNDKNSLKSE